MKYRPDVDGLRAVAVLPVMLFHAGVAGFSGGFVGVDVFFVISGYVIALSLLGDLEKGHFSVLRHISVTYFGDSALNRRSQVVDFPARCGLGPRLAGWRLRPVWRSSVLTNAASPSGRPMVSARRSAIDRSSSSPASMKAAKSG